MSETTMTLVVYIDEKLLKPDANGNPQLANLTLSRKVGGVANVIFQSKSTASFSNYNDFKWGQAYQIGAAQKPPQGGVFVESKTALKNIAAKFMCDWTGVSNMMPDAVPADAGFLAQFPSKQGMFGTKNQPALWYNSIWCSTSAGTYSCIYTDTSNIPGMTYRGYQVENNYQLSWEATSYQPGVFSAMWSSPFPFSIQPSSDPAANKKFLSWGYPPNAGDFTPPQWYDYGTTDPGKHDPSHAGPPSNSFTVSSLGDENESIVPLSAFAPPRVNFRMDWTASYLSSSAQRDHAGKLLEYLRNSTDGWLTLSNIFVGRYLSGSATLKTATAFGDYLPGETQGEKVRFFLKGIVASTSSRYAPDVLDWNYEFGYEKTAGQAVIESLGLSHGLRLIWNGLKQGAASLWASESVKNLAKALQDTLLGQGNNNSTVTYETVTVFPNGTSATTTMSITNLGPDGTTKALQILQDLAQKEDPNVKVSLDSGAGLSDAEDGGDHDGADVTGPLALAGASPLGLPSKALGPAATQDPFAQPAQFTPSGSASGAPVAISPFDSRISGSRQPSGQAIPVR